jgi:hypothetical protein
VCPHATSTDQASAVQAFVIDQAATPERLAKVMVENAARALKRSKLGAMLPSRPLRWAVIEERSDGIVEAWSG